MRIEPAVLLVVLALSIPVIVELRTVAAWVGIDLTLLETGVIGVVVLAAIVAWALSGDSGENGSKPTG